MKSAPALTRIYDGPGAFGDATPDQIITIKANVGERLARLNLVVMWTRDPSAHEQNPENKRELIACVLAEEVAACRGSSGAV